MFPYTPPDLGDPVNNNEPSNDNNSDTDGRNSPVRDQTFIEMTVMPRSYTGLETHYAETPLSLVNPEDPPVNVYEATRITEGWEAGAKGKSAYNIVDTVKETVSGVSTAEEPGASGAAGPPESHSITPPPSPTAHVTPISISTNEHEEPVS